VGLQAGAREVNATVPFILTMTDRAREALDVRSHLASRHARVHLLISPPRCCSTAFARVFWQQPSIGFYSHEPFEESFYTGYSLAGVREKLSHPLDLTDLKTYNKQEDGSDLLVKEMSFQAAIAFPLLAALTTETIFFLIRDPRLSIASRMLRKKEGGMDPVFPPEESGWAALLEQIQQCQEESRPFAIVDASDFRNRPLEIFPRVFAEEGLPFDERMLSWKPCHNLDLDNIDGRHSHWYRRVLASGTILPATEPVPDISAFPTEKGFRDHVRRCLEIYGHLSGLPERIRCDPPDETSISVLPG
jgi:hypothetical protein